MHYAKPATAAEAAKLLKAETGVTRVLAGGTDVLVQLKAGMIEPALIVDIKGIPGIRAITPDAGGFRIGAAVSGAELGDHAALCAAWPGVIEAAQLIGSKQVQGRARWSATSATPRPPRTRPRAGRRRRHRPHRGARWHAAMPPSRPFRPAPARPRSPRARSSPRSSFPPAPPARSDAYLRFIPRTEMDIAVARRGVSLTLDASRHRDRRPRGPGRRCPDRPAGRGCRKGPHRHQA